MITPSFQTKLQQSSLVFELREIARHVFAQWVVNAKEVHNLTFAFAETISFTEIENHFILQLESTIHSLQNDQAIENKQTKDWSYAFLCGHMRGCIDVEWVNKYIIEPSSDYEDLMRLKAIKILLRDDIHSLEGVKNLYEQLIDQRKPPIEENISKQPENVIQLFKNANSQENKAHAENVSFHQEMSDFLTREFEFRYEKILHSSNEICCPNLGDYFPKEKIIALAGEENFH